MLDASYGAIKTTPFSEKRRVQDIWEEEEYKYENIGGHIRMI